MEYGYELCILSFFTVALYCHGKHTYRKGVEDGAEGALSMLEKESIISINEKGEIKGVQNL